SSRSTVGRTCRSPSGTSSRSARSSGRSGSSSRRARSRSGTCSGTRSSSCRRERPVVSDPGRLLELAVSNLALIDRLRLPLAAGLNVLTGETGAGKSLVIDALGLATGARADTSLVRHGAETARVEAVFDRLPEPLIAVREVGSNGRSTARVDDQTVTSGRLAEAVGPL